MVRVGYDSTYSFFWAFDTVTGYYIRDRSEVFMAELPHLVDFAITNRCYNDCVFCYRRSNPLGKHIKFGDFVWAIEQCGGHLQQVALGGGSPELHPNFIDILQVLRVHNIVPNYTSNGLYLTDDIIAATKEYCGQVGISWYRLPQQVSIMQSLLEGGLRPAVHFIVRRETIDEACQILEGKHCFQDIFDCCASILFLTYKPIGILSENSVDYKPTCEQLDKFVHLIEQPHPFKVAIDTCGIASVVSRSTKIDYSYAEFCEGARFSLFIDENLVAKPCSFLGDEWGVKMTRNMSFSDVWYSEAFNRFRALLESVRGSCCNCERFNECRGGCPIFDVNYCRYKSTVINYETA